MRFCIRLSASTLLAVVLLIPGTVFSSGANASTSEPGVYQQVTQKETQKNEKQKKQKDKTECKRVTVTGSHFKRKVCMKQSKWAEIERESREAADRLQDQSGLSGS